MQGTWRFYRSIAIVLALFVTAIWALDTEGGANAGNWRVLSKQPSSLDHALGGPAALVRAGNRLPEVAAANGMTVAELVHELRNDPNILLDLAGLAVYVDEAPAVVPTSEPALPSIGTADAFTLHSRPGAARIIYLDVNGHVTTGTSWNSGGSITSAPFDLDGNPGSFNQVERDRIHAWWLQVSEDFAPWDVDVTTEEPPLDRLRKNSSSDPQHGIRVVISPTNWYSTSASGVAYLNSFSYTTDTPVFVFTDQLGKGNAKTTSETTSHEVGHALGLAHDGNASYAYYSGHANWAPIMGSSFARPVSHWSAGDYTGATNREDDIAIISQKLPVRPDDHGDTPSTATPLGLDSVVQGLIATRADRDVFRIDGAGGPLAISASPVAGYPNLDPMLRVLTSSGTEMAAADPFGPARADILVDLAPGTYYIEVSGVGTGDPSTGYTDYSSLGRYTLTVGGGEGPPPPLTVDPTTTTTVPATTTTVAVTTTTVPVATTTTTTIATTAPVASIAASAVQVAPKQQVTFDARASHDPDGGAIKKYEWHFDGQKPPKGSQSVESRTWSSTGAYTIVLTVTDDEGQTAKTSMVVTVEQAPPTATPPPTTTTPPPATTQPPTTTQPPVPPPDATETVSVASVQVHAGSTAGTWVATVSLTGSSGQPIAGAVVAGTWSGPFKGNTTFTTDSTGAGTSPTVSTPGNGSPKFSVTAVTPPAGMVWNGT